MTDWSASVKMKLVLANKTISELADKIGCSRVYLSTALHRPKQSERFKEKVETALAELIGK